MVFGHLLCFLSQHLVEETPDYSCLLGNYDGGSLHCWPLDPFCVFDVFDLTARGHW